MINATIQGMNDSTHELASTTSFDPSFLLMLLSTIIAAYLFYTLLDKYLRRTVTCSKCSNLGRRRFMRKQDGKYYCLSCYKKEFNVCDYCTKIVKEKLITWRRKKLCDKCIKDCKVKCKYCNRLTAKWESINGYCQTCFDLRRRKSFESIYLKTIKNPSRIFKKNPYKRYCGIEIECLAKDKRLDCFNKTELKKLRFSQVRDSSLNRGGIEFVSLPINGDLLLSSVKNMCKELRRKRYKIDKSCGLHIHLEVPKKLNYLKKIYSFYQKFEPLMFNMVPKSRQRTSYCHKFKRIYHHDAAIMNEAKTFKKFKSLIYDTKDEEEIQDCIGSKYDNKRYCWANLHSIFHRGTLEIRNHAGTISELKIRKWLSLHLRILDYLEKADLETIKELKVDKKTFLSIFSTSMQKYINFRWEKFEKGNKEEGGK